MDVSDFIIGIIALNERYSRHFESGFAADQKTLTHDILAHYPHPLLRAIGIHPHFIHQDSLTLYKGLSSLTQSGILRLWIPGLHYTWGFPLSPSEYFAHSIKPRLTAEELSELERFAKSI